MPDLNDDEAHIKALKEFIKDIPNVEKVELLPYKIIGAHKYKNLGLKYALEGTLEMDEQRCKQLEEYLKKHTK